MNTIRIPKPSKKFIAGVTLVVLLLLTPLLVYLVRQQQDLRQQASSTTQQSATSSCGTDGVIITVQYKNATTTNVQVLAKDMQTNKSVDLGTIKPNETKIGAISTKEIALTSGFVLFSITGEGSSYKDSQSATYNAITNCTKPTQNLCTEEKSRQGYCKWDLVSDATKYTVKVKDASSGATIKEETVNAPASQSAFLMERGKSYICSVIPVSACTTGGETESPEKMCPLPTPPPYCPAEPEKEAACTWDAVSGASEYTVKVVDTESGETIKSEKVAAPATRMIFPTQSGKTYACSVSAVNTCSTTTPVESEPSKCSVPTPTQVPPTQAIPTPITTVAIPTPTDVPVPTPTQVPTNTPTPVPPTATSTPRPPAPTTVVAVPNVPKTVPPQSNPPAPVAQTPRSVAQPQPTSAPTLPPTGSSTITVVLGAVVTALTVMGAIIFFVL